MTNAYNNIIYQDIKKLEEKLISLNGVIDENIYNAYLKEISDIKQRLIDLPDKPSYDLIKPITADITALELKFNNELGEHFKNIVKQSILTQLSIVEEYISQDTTMVEEIIEGVEKKLADGKYVYDDVEYDDIETKILSIKINIIIEKMRNGKSIDKKTILSFQNDNGYKLLRNLLAIKAKELTGLEKAMVEAWRTEITDTKSGFVDNNRFSEIITKPKFWEIISQAKQVEKLIEDSKSQSDTSNKPKTFDEIRQEEIEEIATKYGFTPEELETKGAEVLCIKKTKDIAGNAKYKIHKMNADKWAKSSNKNVVACIFANAINTIVSFKEKENEILQYVVLPRNLYAIRSSGVFANSLIKTINFPDRLNLIGDSTFEHAQLKKVICNSGLEYIGVRAFANNYNLEEVQLNKALKEIDREAFYNTNWKLKQVLISNRTMLSMDISENPVFPESCKVEYEEEPKQEETKKEKPKQVPMGVYVKVRTKDGKWKLIDGQGREIISDTEKPINIRDKGGFNR